MRLLHEILSKLKEEYSKLSILGIAVVIICFIPDWDARGEFWIKTIKSAIPHLASPGGRVCLLILGCLIIWLDHRRFLATHGKPHPKSLQARCLKVRDAMQKYLDSFGEQDMSGEADAEWLARVSNETGRRWGMLGHYYDLNCASEVERIYHEFGVRGVHEIILERGELRSLKKEEHYVSIIGALTKLADRPEAKIKI